jgi:hypothetical protein
MRRTAIVVATCFVTALALISNSEGQTRNLDTIMKEISAVWQNRSSGLGARGVGLSAPNPNTANIAADSTRLQALFTETAAEFTRLKMAEPARIAKSAADAAGALAKEAKGGKISDAKASLDAIGQCKVCHDPVTGYREPDGDGGFKVKAR